MQKVLIIGYLARDPEVRYSAQGTVIAQFSVATTERWKDKRRTTGAHGMVRGEDFRPSGRGHR